MVPPHNPDSEAEAVDTATLIQQLRRKEGHWVEWGLACQTLQKSGMDPQAIFEATGFEPVQQNQIVVAAQVYQSIAAVGVDEGVRSHFQQRGSDLLYEMRILSQADRARTAEFALKHNLDVDEVKDLVKPIKEYSYRRENPEGFTDEPGDGVAFHFWKLARQTSDLAMRSRLIAQGLRYAHSPSARQKIESLLTDLTVVKSRPAPIMPLYRLESETELPRMIPVAGSMPLSTEDFSAVPLILAEDPFGLVTCDRPGAWVAVPGWQVILQAEDPVAVLSQSDQLPQPLPGSVEPILIVLDRAQREWNADSYFGVEVGGDLYLGWYEEAPSERILGQVILMMRPKRILDEDYSRELWQVDE